MQRSSPQTIDQLLLHVVDAGLAGVVFVVPLLMGGRHPLGQLVLVGLALAMGLAWAGHLWCCGDPRWRPSRAAPLLLAGAALALLQCTPLPNTVLQWIAPRNAQLLPLWSSPDAGLGVWHYLSMIPAETRAGLVIFLAYALVFLVSAQRIRNVEDVERVLRWCATAAIGMASFGLIQFFGGNGKYFWFYEHFQCGTSDAVKGSFTNRNHFAHFMALGVGPLIWWLQDALRNRSGSTTAAPTYGTTPRRNGEFTAYLLSLSLGIVLFAGLLSLSRGGIMAMALAVAIVTIVCYRASSLGNRFLGVLAAAVLLIGVSLAVFGYDRVSTRMDSLSSASLDEIDRGAGRRNIWAATLASIPDRLWFGAGAGSFAEVYPAYADLGIREDIEATHGENGYLQVALEHGLAGLALVVGGIVLCGWWCCRGLARAVPARLRLCAGTIAASLAASVVHSAVDFVWYVPACMGMVAILAAAALRVRQMADRDSTAQASVGLPRFAPAVAGALLAVVGIWMVGTMVGPAIAAPSWNRYCIAVEALKAESLAAENAGTLAAPSGHPPELEDERKLIADLEHVISWQPGHARAHMALAESHLRLFERLQTTAVNPMSLINVRDAVLQSHFTSQRAMTEWLSRAVGEHWRYLETALQHTRQTLTLCPLQGRGYVYLAEMCFLDKNLRLPTSAYIDQALRVRPHDARVLWGAASDAYLAGDSAMWLEYAKKAFHGSGRRQQRQMMTELIGQTTAETVPAMIDFIVRQFQPDLVGLRFLYNVCVDRCPADRLTPLVKYLAEFSESEASRLGKREAAGIWLDAHSLYRRLGNEAKSLQCIRNAVQSDPNHYDAHYQLAIRLLQQKIFTEAESHLKWCRQRRPGDQSIEPRLREALKGRLDAQLRVSAENQDGIAR